MIFINGCQIAMDIDEAMIYYENNSDTAIHIVAKMQYADTIMPNIFSENTHRGTVEPHNKYDALIVFDFLKDSDTTSFFIIKKNDVVNYSWEEIADKRMFLCIYVLSKKDISILSGTEYNKTIPYPPSPAMKDMKMYPPYEEVIKQ